MVGAHAQAMYNQPFFRQLVRIAKVFYGVLHATIRGRHLARTLAIRSCKMCISCKALAPPPRHHPGAFISSFPTLLHEVGT